MLTRRLAASAVVAVLGAAGFFAAAAPANASDKVEVKAPHVFYPDYPSGHAWYKYSTNHGWVCDDWPDGFQIYAVWYFNGGIFGTAYRRNAPAYSDGCKGDFFDKRPYAVKVCVNVPDGRDSCTYKDL